jgi:hypothetical protein
MVAVIAAVVLLVHPHRGSENDPASTGSVDAASLMPITGRLRYGMTEQRVLRRVGRPTKTLRDPDAMECWEYDVRQGRLDAVRVCFYAGEYEAAHFEIDGTWDYRRTKPKLTS